MALIKQQIINDRLTGDTVSLDYWKVVNLSLDKKSMTLRCNLSLFINKEYARSCSYPAMTRSFMFEVVQEDLFGDMFALAYEKIRENLGDCKLTGATND